MVTGLSVCRTDVVIDRLTGLFGDLEPHRLPSLLLAHCRAINGVSVRRNVLDFEGNDIATAQLTVDGQIEHRQVAFAVCDLELCADRPDVFWPERRFGSYQLALVPSGSLEMAAAAFSLLGGFSAAMARSCRRHRGSGRGPRSISSGSLK
jgi:hypothetical protein